MKRFGFDLDGVLYDWYKVVHDYFVHHKGETRTYGEFWIDLFHNDKDNYGDFFWNNLTKIPIFYSTLIPSQEVVNTVQEMSGIYDIVYITHRPQEVEHVTRKWLKDYGFPNPEKLYLTRHPKEIAVRRYGCDYYIEDKPEILTSNLRNVTTLIAKRTLWNWEACENLPYVDFIPELPKLLQELI